MTLFSSSVELDVLEAAAAQFKERIGFSYIEYPNG